MKSEYMCIHNAVLYVHLFFSLSQSILNFFNHLQLLLPIAYTYSQVFIYYHPIY
jgi:hypothetical protein